MAAELVFSSEIIVVGSGPGGATAARQLARGGKKVLVLERGADHRKKAYYGTYLGAMIYAERGGLLFSQEGLQIIRPLMVGGATSMYCGCASPPPSWLKEKYGIHMDAEVEETIRELEIAPLPEDLRGAASTRIAQAAQGLGYDWYPQPKFMRPSSGKSFSCSASCMLGCRCGAKWNAAEYVDEALAEGAEIITQARVNHVLMEDGQAVGVAGKLRGVPFIARGETVILSAGAIGTPLILHESGFRDAGVGMAMDTTVMIYGLIREQGTGNEPPMTWSWENDDVGYMLSTLTDPWLLYPLVAARSGLKYAFLWPKWKNILGVMIKLKDEISGGVYPGGKISKPLTHGDNERLRMAQEVCRKILVEAGANRSNIFMTPLRGTHPSGTARIGTMVDQSLETEAKGLYVCDASVFPEALDRPTVLTIIGLGKRLARHLLSNDV